MADKIQKALAKFGPKERKAIDAIISKLLANELVGLDIKQLVGHTNVYRVRKGTVRIIFSKATDGGLLLLDISRRSEKTYRNF